MPRLSLYRPNKTNDYRFFDRSISEMFTVGGTDLYIHKYLGPADTGPSIDYTQPEYVELKPTNIQDLLFLENRDRVYDQNIYRLRGHYNVQNLDFDLSQFGLFLTNDIIFIEVHYNDMIDIVGRKLMVGDVIELPHLLDYNPLDETLPVALKRFYQITDANYSSGGFSQTWYPHIWRIKCEPLINSQEFQNILNKPVNEDNYLGNYDETKTYPPGYTVQYGDKIYESIQEVPPGTTPPDPLYWSEVQNGTLADIISTYNKNIAINDAALQEASRLVPKSGYNVQNLYVVPTYGPESDKFNQPAPPVDVVAPYGPPTVVTGQVAMIVDPKYKNPSYVLRIKKQDIDKLKKLAGDTENMDAIDKFIQASLETVEIPPVLSDTGSGSVESTFILAVGSLGLITGPYGTADNTYATADVNPNLPSFTGEITPEMNFKADCNPQYQFIARYSPRSFGYLAGYLTGTDQAPNGLPVQAGISFPQNPSIGDYFLRIDYYPQILYRWSGDIWVRISENVRTETGFTIGDESQLSSFINNDNVTILTDGGTTPEKQGLSTILTQPPDTLPPVT